MLGRISEPKMGKAEEAWRNLLASSSKIIRVIISRSSRWMVMQHA
jgi:hypothetical protein